MSRPWGAKIEAPSAPLVFVNFLSIYYNEDMNAHRVKIEAPEKFSGKTMELAAYMKKYNPVLMLEKITGRKLKNGIILKHRTLRQEAKFKNNIIYADFNNKVKYIWLCLCHELAHIILENPSWDRKRDIQKIVVKHNKERISRYKYTFPQAIGQTAAILLQAACENEAGIRKLKWDQWETTFDYMRVKDFGQKFWKDWTKYLKKNSEHKNIDDWILSVLKKHFG